MAGTTNFIVRADGQAYFAGSLGIGTTNPVKPLDVSGTIRTSANTATGDAGGIVFPDGTPQTTAWTGVLCGGDYAEAVKAADGKKAYGPGDVLVLSEGGKQDVAKASEPYSTMVAGIYATKPGVVGRRQSLAMETDNLPWPWWESFQRRSAPRTVRFAAAICWSPHRPPALQ